MIKKVLKLLIVFIISIIIGNTLYGIYKEAKISDTPGNNEKESEFSIAELMMGKSSKGIAELNEDSTNTKDSIEDDENENKENKQDSELSKAKVNLPTTYKGYAVSAKLYIPKIDLNTYILDDKSDEAMWICPTKYYGPEPNEVGNYCIAAHNYDKENMFNHIIELEIGDTIYLADNKNGTVEYEVYDIYKAIPTDTEALLQNTNGKAEITLITCSDYSSKRIIVKAKMSGLGTGSFPT